MPETLRLHVIWTSPLPTAGGAMAAEFGMQSGRSTLLPGRQRPDGATVFATSVEPYTDARGRARFRGDCVQGPPDEPFLYLSHRFVGGSGWIGRGKALLTPLTAAFLATLPAGDILETKMSRLGHREPGTMTVWTPVSAWGPQHSSTRRARPAR